MCPEALDKPNNTSNNNSNKKYDSILVLLGKRERKKADFN
jgi:hypothetical protein